MPGKPQEKIMIDKAALKGKWLKSSTAPCGHDYPDIMVFQDDGLYSGTMNTPGEFTRWDVGTYSVASARQIKLSTANDALITYDVSLSGSALIVVDPDGCEVRYRRSDDAGSP
jgi:hypothetical protein